MTATAIIKQASDDGVTITASSTGHLKLVGDQTAVNRWVPVIREHKSGILAALQPDPAVIAIKAWLDFIGETHQPIIDEVLQMVATDPEALRYFLWRSTEIPAPNQTEERIK